MKMQIKGICADTAILSIAKYLVDIDTENLSLEVNYLVEKYGFVPEDCQEDFKNDIKNAYKFQKEKKTKSIDSIAYLKFKAAGLMKNNLEQNLVLELQTLV